MGSIASSTENQRNIEKLKKNVSVRLQTEFISITYHCTVEAEVSLELSINADE